MSEWIEMPSTMWTVISTARREGGPALETILRKYRPPVLAFLRQSGFGAEDAEDLAQETFLTLLQDDVLSKADRERGRFRSLLLAVARHTASEARRNAGRLKRGGGTKTHSLDANAGEGRARYADFVGAPETEESFDRLWVENLVRLGLDRLREECEQENRPYFQALFLFANEGLGYPEVAEKLSVKLSDVKNYVFQARVRLKRFILREVNEYSSSRSEYESEIAYIERLLA